MVNKRIVRSLENSVARPLPKSVVWATVASRSPDTLHQVILCMVQSFYLDEQIPMDSDCGGDEAGSMQ